MGCWHWVCPSWWIRSHSGEKSPWGTGQVALGGHVLQAHQEGCGRNAHRRGCLRRKAQEPGVRDGPRNPTHFLPNEQHFGDGPGAA